MNLDFEICYRAITSRDQRFDGRFFTAVTTTGIYCRPVCPAQTPKRGNVRFYPSAAAARAAGFRACKRCRPEAAPDAPLRDARGDLVGRALGLIAAGAVDDGRVDGVARQLAVSPRHLHRELNAAVGLGPLALARMRRAQTARLLIEGTTMPLGEVASAAGFSSIRQFNHSVREIFGRTPSELRRLPIGEAVPGAGEIAVRLAYRAPLDVPALLRFLARTSAPGVQEVEGNRLRRALRVGDAGTIVELEFPEGTAHAVLRLWLEDPSRLGPLVTHCRRWFDLDVDAHAVMTVLASDPVLADLVAERPGVRLPGAVDGWEMAVQAVLAQQVSTTGARTLAGRLVRTLGEPLPRPWGTLTHLFPTPEAVADSDLTGAGLIRSRAQVLRGLARAVATGEIVLDGEVDPEETRRRLLAVPGIGPWTVSYIAMRALRDPDAFPTTDLALVRAYERLGGEPGTLGERAERWRPWRGYAAMYLWTGGMKGDER